MNYGHTFVNGMFVKKNFDPGGIKRAIQIWKMKLYKHLVGIMWNMTRIGPIQKDEIFA